MWFTVEFRYGVAPGSGRGLTWRLCSRSTPTQSTTSRSPPSALRAPQTLSPCSGSGRLTIGHFHVEVPQAQSLMRAQVRRRPRAAALEQLLPRRRAARAPWRAGHHRRPHAAGPAAAGRLGPRAPGAALPCCKAPSARGAVGEGGADGPGCAGGCGGDGGPAG
jgi:hypothetical protein